MRNHSTRQCLQGNSYKKKNPYEAIIKHFLLKKNKLQNLGGSSYLSGMAEIILEQMDAQSITRSMHLSVSHNNQLYYLLVPWWYIFLGLWPGAWENHYKKSDERKRERRRKTKYKCAEDGLEDLPHSYLRQNQEGQRDTKQVNNLQKLYILKTFINIGVDYWRIIYEYIWLWLCHGLVN